MYYLIYRTLPQMDSNKLKIIGYLNPNLLIINNFLLLLLVFGPALLVTIILVFNKFSNS